MLISLEWVRDFVDIPLENDPQKIGERFTLGTAEVEGIEVTNQHLAKIKVVEVVAVEKHPEADKIRLVTFHWGTNEKKIVVCGASNVRVGLKTAYAPLGTVLPNGLKLEPKKIRGFLSEGMLCSDEELGFAEESAGIVELDTKAPLGQNLLKYFQETQDVILDVDNKSLTHRPDLWGQMGLAREFAAVFDRPFCNPYKESWAKKIEEKFNDKKAPVSVKIQGESACLAYWGLTIEGIKVGPSPKWMQSRLKRVGLRSINNIVDISNYVMMELGIPNHIFDRDQIKGDKVLIHRPNKESQFVTLDEIERSLKPSDTVISDSAEVLVLAGIMGGLKSGVSEKTKTIFLEVANWRPSEVRSTSTRLGLRTDSLQRYEKSLDSTLTYRTLLRLVELIFQVCPTAKVIGRPVYDGQDLKAIRPQAIKTSISRINNFLGTQESEEKIIKIFESLEFSVEKQKDSILVTPPSYRSTKDIECESCLVEEIGRIIGFDNIIPKAPLLEVRPTRLNSQAQLDRKLKDFLAVKACAFEIMTYPMIGEELCKKVSWPISAGLELINSLSRDHSLMRDSLIPSFLEVAHENAKNFDQFRFFELGRTYHSSEKDFSLERPTLGLAFYERKRSCFVDLLEVVEQTLGACSLPAELVGPHPKFKNELVDESWPGIHPFEWQNIRLMGKMKGIVFSVHPQLLRSLKIKGHLSFAFLDISGLGEVSAKDRIRYTPLNKYPGSSFDWTLMVDSKTPVESILTVLKKQKIKALQSVKVADIFYADDQNKMVTLRASFLDPEGTLSGEFLTQATSQLIAICEKAGLPLKK